MALYHNTAVAFGNLKDALLFFDYVIPMNLTGEFMGLRPHRGGNGGAIRKTKEPTMDDYNELVEVFGEPNALTLLYPPPLANHPNFQKIANVFDGALFSYMVNAVYGKDAYRTYVDNLSAVVELESPTSPRQVAPTIEDIQILFNRIVTDFNLQGMPIDCTQYTLPVEDEPAVENSLLVHEVTVIDTEKVSFQQIMEFREDPEVMKRMRNFRLFAYESYQGKDRAFIEDDLQKRFEEYTETVRASRFETRVSTLSSLMNSKLLLGSLATSAASLLMGNPQLAIGAFSAGATLEFGKIVLEFARRSNAMCKISSQNSISYIADAKQLLEDQPN